METINKIIKSKYAPKDRGVIWIDTTGEAPVQKVWDGGWKPISGTIKVIPNKVGNNFNVYPDVYIDCGIMSNDSTFILEGKKNNKIAQHYFIAFDAFDTYNITWPENLSWLNDKPLEETESNTHYEVSILDTYASYAAFALPDDN